jgi:hypothetical protein
MRGTARGPLFDIPTSKLATLSGRLGWFALAVVLLSIVIVRAGILEIVPALATFAAALVAAALAVLLALAAFVVIWRTGLGGLRRAVGGLLIGLAILAYPGYFGYHALKLPMISDITTDADNPPRFEVLARLRPRGSSQYEGARAAELQEEGYPDIEALEHEAPAAVAYRVALAAVTARKWHIVDTVPPAGPRRPGTIEAVARTFIMGFRDDVVVRVTAVGRGSRIDVRSASRYGMHDFGANAARVTALLSDIDDAMSALVVEPVAQPEPKKRPEPQRRRPRPRPRR